MINRIREAASTIKKLLKDKNKDKDNDVDKLICEAGWGTKVKGPSMINDIKKLTKDSNRKLIEAAIILSNELLLLIIIIIIIDLIHTYYNSFI